MSFTTRLHIIIICIMLTFMYSKCDYFNVYRYVVILFSILSIVVDNWELITKTKKIN